MNFNDYQKKALKTDSYFKGAEVVAVTDLAFLNKVLGLVSESGEVADKIKKIMRNKDGKMDKADKTEIIKELGDVLWYLTLIASYLGEDLATVAQGNIEKLYDRQARGKINSTGDNR